MTDKIEEIRKRHVKALQTPSDWWTVMGDDANRDRHTLLAELDRICEETERLREQLEFERMRVVACGAVALADTPESATEARKMYRDCRSASLCTVEFMVDASIALRAENVQLREALRWYADPLNHSPVKWRHPGEPDPSVVFLMELPPVIVDGGRRARQALDLEGKP